MKKALIAVICVLVGVCEGQDLIEEISHSTSAITRAIDQNQLDPIITHDFQKAKELVEKHIDVNAQDEDGNTPLMFLARLMEPLCRGISEEKIQRDIVFDIENVAEIVLENGADVYIKNKTGSTALEEMQSSQRGYWLILAVRSGREDLVKLLLDETTVNTRDITNNTPLIWSARIDQSLDIAKLLIDCGADVNAVNVSHNTALMAAAQLFNVELVKLLLDHPKIDLNVKDIYGFTVLKAMKETGKHISLDSEKHSKLLEIIKILEEKGAEE